MPKIGLELSQVEKEYDKLLKKIGDNAETLTKVLEDLDTDLDELKYEKAIYGLAFGHAYSILEKNAMDVVVNAAKIGCIQSKEFNYFPYIEHLTNAIKGNTEGLVLITPNKSTETVEIKVDFSPLGHVDSWGDAIKAVRKKLQELGLSRRSYISEPATASRMWAEKIYKTAREGGKVPRTRKAKGSKRGDNKFEKVDVTADYKWRYKATIEARLAELSKGEAPYWYLIEHGNVNMSSDRGGGEAYPTFGATNFIKLAGDKLKKFWEEAFDWAEKKAEEFLADTLPKEYGFEGGTKSFREMEEDVIRQALDAVDKQILGTTKSQRLITQIRENNRIVDIVETATGRLAKNEHDPLTGRFMRVPR